VVEQVTGLQPNHLAPDLNNWRSNLSEEKTA
jgi:hypothetical protein